MHQPRAILALATLALGFLSVAGTVQASTIFAYTGDTYYNNVTHKFGVYEEPKKGELKFDIDTANKDASVFTGHAPKKSNGLIKVTTTGHVDTGAGYANIKPVKDGKLTDLLFTPANSKQFGNFYFRGQLEDGVSSITMKVVTALGLTDTHTWTGLKSNLDNKSMGVWLAFGAGHWQSIKSIELISDGFKEVKQIDVSYAPVPAALPMFGAAIAGLGGLRRLARRKQDAKPA
jgi:hypothetical protein